MYNCVNDVRQTKMCTAEPLVPEPRYFVVEVAIEKLVRYKASGTEQIPAELIPAGSNTLHSEISDLLIVFGIRKNCHSS
jgi:hypothetical protein